MGPRLSGDCNFRPVDFLRPCALPLFFQHRLKVLPVLLVNISLSRELRALGIGPETATPVQPVQPEPVQPEPVQPVQPVQTAPIMPEGFKVRQPKEFDGSDTSLSTVTAWAFGAKEYMELAAIPAASQTRLAGSWLEDTAKVWCDINTYQEVDTLPELKVFIKAFKEHH